MGRKGGPLPSGGLRTAQVVTLPAGAPPHCRIQGTLRLESIPNNLSASGTLCNSFPLLGRELFHRSKSSWYVVSKCEHFNPFQWKFPRPLSLPPSVNGDTALSGSSSQGLQSSFQETALTLSFPSLRFSKCSPRTQDRIHSDST